MKCHGKMYQGHQLEQKMVSPDPAHQEKGVCDHGLFTADMQLTAKTQHLAKILKISRPNPYQY